MRSLKTWSNRPSEIISTITILKILEEMVINKYVTKTFLVRRLNSRNDVITKYLKELESKGIINVYASPKITIYSLNEQNDTALLIKEFILKWIQMNPEINF